MINFNKKPAAGNATKNIDVSVTSGHQSGKDKDNFLRFSFSKSVALMVFGEEAYGTTGQDPNNPNRIYFQKDTSISGYKISGVNESIRKYSTFGCCYPEKKYGEFIGYYDIQFDKVNGAFYIDLANKKTY